MSAIIDFRTLRKNVLLLVIGAVGLIIILIGVSVYLFLPIHASSLSNIQWKNSPPLLVFQNVGRLDRTGMLFVRPNDSRELFFAGEWQAEKSNNAFYAFGEFPPDYNEAKGQQLYFVSSDTVHQIKLSLDPGQKITSVRENPKSTYFFIEITKDNKSYYCIAKRVFPSDLSCKTLTLNKRTQARWNPDKERELVILTEDNVLFTYENELKRVHLNENKEQYQQLSALFLPVSVAEYGKFWRFFNIMAMQKADNYTLYRIPFFIKNIFWFVDDNHLLLVASNSVRVFELSTRKYAPIITEEYIGRALTPPL